MPDPNAAQLIEGYSPPISPATKLEVPLTESMKSLFTNAEQYLTISPETQQRWKQALQDMADQLDLEHGNQAFEALANIMNTPAFRLAVELKKHESDPTFAQWQETYDQFCLKAGDVLAAHPVSKRTIDAKGQINSV